MLESETRSNVMIKNRRPTSPHITIYKPQISSVLSISHRMTGVALFFFLVTVSWCAVGFIFYQQCECTNNIINSKIFQLAMLGITFCGFYHFFNGIRHLFWDIGLGFSIQELHFSGWFVIVLAILSTAFTWSQFL